MELLNRYFPLQVVNFSSVQSLSRVWLFATPWTAARQASLSITNSQSLLKLMCIKLVMLSNNLILCHPLLLLPSVFPSIRVFLNESIICIKQPKYWSFSFSISPSNEHPGMISFRMDWLDLLSVQGTLKSLLQHHSSKASILQRSAFFTVRLSHPYMTSGTTIVSNSANLWNAALQASLPITNSRSLLKLMSIESLMPFNHLILCRPLLLCLQYFPASGSFQWVISSHQVAKVLASVLPINIQDWFPLQLTGLISLQSKQLSRVFSNTTVQKHQFFGAQLSSQSDSHIHTWPLEKP